MRKLHISNHAIDRYRERVGPLPHGIMDARATLLGMMAFAKPKHIRKIAQDKRTVMVPLRDCIFVFEGLSMVTVLERKAA